MIMTREEYQQSLKDVRLQITTKLFSEKERFYDWMRKIWGVSIELEQEYNLYYHILYTTFLVEFLTEGEKYILESIETLKKVGNKPMLDWSCRVRDGIQEIKNQYTDEEFIYLEYRRHNSCHIFTKGYESIQDNGKIKKVRQVCTKQGGKKEILLDDFDMLSYDVLSKYGGAAIGDKNFDIAKHQLVAPVLNRLFNDLNNMRLAELGLSNIEINLQDDIPE